MKHIVPYDLLVEDKGDCYQAGGRLIMSFFGDKDHKLVHGMVSGQGALEGKRFGHCWVESRDTVLDHSNDKKLEIPKQIYYLMGRIDPAECHYYTAEEAAKKMSTIKHWGPWDMAGDTVKDTYKEYILKEASKEDAIPDNKKEIGKKELKIKNKDMKNIKKYEDFVKESKDGERVTKKMWKKMTDDQRVDALGSATDNIEFAEDHFEDRWEELPDEYTANMWFFGKKVGVDESVVNEKAKWDVEVEEPFSDKSEKGAQHKFIFRFPSISIASSEGHISEWDTYVKITFSNYDTIEYTYEGDSNSKPSVKCVIQYDGNNTYQLNEDRIGDYIGSTGTVIGDLGLIYSNFKEGKLK